MQGETVGKSKKKTFINIGRKKKSTVSYIMYRKYVNITRWAYRKWILTFLLTKASNSRNEATFTTSHKILLINSAHKTL